MATIDFPEGLPKPLRSGYGVNHVSPLMRSELQSGRARQRRKYTSVPSIASVSWLFTQSQAQAFESWFRWEIVDGAEWFNATLSTPMGLQPYECRFVDMYSGPELVGINLWRFTANLEIRERQTFGEDWQEAVPDYILYSSIFDRAMNQEWPV
jgi:hypothetical protein